MKRTPRRFHCLQPLLGARNWILSVDDDQACVDVECDVHKVSEIANVREEVSK